MQAVRGVFWEGCDDTLRHSGGDGYAWRCAWQVTCSKSLAAAFDFSPGPGPAGLLPDDAAHCPSSACAPFIDPSPAQARRLEVLCGPGSDPARARNGSSLLARFQGGREGMAAGIDGKSVSVGEGDGWPAGARRR